MNPSKPKCGTRSIKTGEDSPLQRGGQDEGPKTDRDKVDNTPVQYPRSTEDRR